MVKTPDDTMQLFKHHNEAIWDKGNGGEVNDDNESNTENKRWGLPNWLIELYVLHLHGKHSERNEIVRSKWNGHQQH